MRGDERMADELTEARCLSSEHDESESSDQPKVLEELPEMFEARAFLESPEFGIAPELMKQDCGDDAESGQNERREAIVPARHDADGSKQFHGDRRDQHSPGPEDAAGLLHGGRPVEDFIQSTEWEQDDQENPQHRRCVIVHERHEINRSRVEVFDG